MMSVGPAICEPLVPESLKQLAREHKLAQFVFQLFPHNAEEPGYGNYGSNIGEVLIHGISNTEINALWEEYDDDSTTLTREQHLLLRMSPEWSSGCNIVIHRVVDGDAAAIRSYNSMLLYFDAVMEKTAQGFFFLLLESAARGRLA